MPTLNINKFFGLHDGIPEQPGFASKCDNLWITEHLKLSKRGGIQQLLGDDLLGTGVGGTAAIFTMEAPKALWADDTDYGQFNIRTIFVLEGTGKLWYRNPNGSWAVAQTINSFNLPASSQITSANISVFNDIAILNYTTKSDLTSTHDNFSFMLWSNSGSYAWRMAPAFGITRAFTDNLSNEGEVEDLGGGANARLVLYNYRLGISTHKGNSYEIVGRTTIARAPEVSFKIYFPAISTADYEAGASFTMDAYLSLTNGTTLYRHPSQDVSTGASTTKTFTAGDTADTSGALPYIQAGEIDNNEFRLMSNIACKTSNNIFWCLDEETGRIRQSKPSQPYAWPGSFETSFSDRVTGLGAVDRYPVVFTESGCSRIEGFLTADGNGSSRVVTISDTVGAINHDGIVQVDKVLYFLSHDGVYMTNGFNIIKVSKHINKTYAAFFNEWDTYSNVGAVSSVYDSVNKMIFWVLKNPGFGEEVLVGYPEMKHSEGISFTTMTQNSLLRGTKLGYIKNALLMADVPSDGVFMLPTSTKEVDPDLDSPLMNYHYDKISNGDIRDIVFDYLSTPMSFGSNLARKWVSRMIVTFNKLTQSFNVSSGVYGVNDHNGEHSMKPIRHVDSTRLMPVIKRFFPSGFLRSTHKQVGLRSEDVVITTSTEYGLLGSLVSNNFTVAGAIFPTTEEGGFKGYYIQFSHENYLNNWTISTNGIDMIQLVNNPANDSTDVAWKIYGIPKDEPLLVDNISVDYTLIGEGHIDYTPERGGENV